jgi:hypothetical protein
MTPLLTEHSRFHPADGASQDGGQKVSMIEGIKGIAKALTKKTGFSYATETVRKLMRRPNDPLPVERFDGRVGISAEALDGWIERHKGIRRGPRPA